MTPQFSETAMLCLDSGSQCLSQNIKPRQVAGLIMDPPPLQFLSSQGLLSCIAYCVQCLNTVASYILLYFMITYKKRTSLVVFSLELLRFDDPINSSF